MSTTIVQDILKKINYIEAEVEIQKQILFSIPGDQKKEIETIVEKIAKAKNQIIQLREEIKQISPAEYQKIIDIEKGLSQFKELAAQKTFKDVENMTPESPCRLKCQDGSEISYLLKAHEENGDITVLTIEGEVLNFRQDEIVSEE